MGGARKFVAVLGVRTAVVRRGDFSFGSAIQKSKEKNTVVFKRAHKVQALFGETRVRVRAKYSIFWGTVGGKPRDIRQGWSFAAVCYKKMERLNW